MKRNLLPKHLSELERDIELSLARIEDIEIKTVTLWNPFDCPVDVLPFLAWAVSVDQWDATWSEQTKRQMILESIHMHSIKGTRRAVDYALRAFGLIAEIKEWFQFDPPAKRGTFRLIAWVNDNSIGTEIVNAKLYPQIRAVVNDAKNVRSHYDFQVGAKFGAGIGIATNLSAFSVVKFEAEAVRP